MNILIDEKFPHNYFQWLDDLCLRETYSIMFNSWCEYNGQ